MRRAARTASTNAEYKVSISSDIRGLYEGEHAVSNRLGSCVLTHTCQHFVAVSTLSRPDHLNAKGRNMIIQTIAAANKRGAAARPKVGGFS